MAKKFEKETLSGRKYWEDEKGNREYEKETLSGRRYREYDTEDSSYSGSGGGGGGCLVGIMLMAGLALSIQKGINNHFGDSVSDFGGTMSSIDDGFENTTLSYGLQGIPSREPYGTTRRFTNKNQLTYRVPVSELNGRLINRTVRARLLPYGITNFKGLFQLPINNFNAGLGYLHRFPFILQKNNRRFHRDDSDVEAQKTVDLRIAMGGRKMDYGLASFKNNNTRNSNRKTIVYVKR
ncbi:MAG: hypothetical protein Q8Q42_01435 [Nanoarchaeota archaeon]|nr:hypothetical protein [Nanoarchaeota archaeon]